MKGHTYGSIDKTRTILASSVLRWRWSCGATSWTARKYAATVAAR
jgi:hypothetical protein